MESAHRRRALRAAVAGTLIAGSATAGTSPHTTSFTSLSPVPDQTFFIGDGLTGNGSGSRQQSAIPSGASELVLGFSDACNYNGPIELLFRQRPIAPNYLHHRFRCRRAFPSNARLSYASLFPPILETGPDP